MMKIILIVLMFYFFQISYSQQVPELTEKAIIKTATVHCTLDTLWWKWTTHEGLLTFFGADNKIEFKTGGPFEIYFSKDAPAGLKGSEGCTVLSFIPKKMMSFSWNAPPSFMEARQSGYHTCVVVEFNAISGNITEVTLTHSGWPDDRRWDGVYEYFDVAWNKVMEWLLDSCNKRG